MRISFIKFLGAVMAFSSLCYASALFADAADGKGDEKAAEKVMRQLEDFFAGKRKRDRYAVAKEEKVRDIVPMVMKNSPMDQWMDYFTFYYQALDELDKAGQFMTPELRQTLSPSPDDLLGLYIDDERLRAAEHLLKSQEEKEHVLLLRFDELVAARQAGKIRISEMTGRMYAAAFVYVPLQDKLLDLMRKRIELASRLRLGEINVKVFDRKWAAMTKEYMSKNKDSLRLPGS